MHDDHLYAQRSRQVNAALNSNNTIMTVLFIFSRNEPVVSFQLFHTDICRAGLVDSGYDATIKVDARQYSRVYVMVQLDTSKSKPASRIIKFLQSRKIGHRPHRRERYLPILW